MKLEDVPAWLADVVAEVLRYILGGYAGAFIAIAAENHQLTARFLLGLLAILVIFEIVVRLLNGPNAFRDTSQVDKEDLKAALRELANEEEVIVRQK